MGRLKFMNNAPVITTKNTIKVIPKEAGVTNVLKAGVSIAQATKEYTKAAKAAMGTKWVQIGK